MRSSFGIRSDGWIGIARHDLFHPRCRDQGVSNEPSQIFQAAGNECEPTSTTYFTTITTIYHLVHVLPCHRAIVLLLFPLLFPPPLLTPLLLLLMLILCLSALCDTCTRLAIASHASASHSSVEASPPPIFSPAGPHRAAVFAPTSMIRRLRLINFCLEKQLT